MEKLSIKELMKQSKFAAQKTNVALASIKNQIHNYGVNPPTKIDKITKRILKMVDGWRYDEVSDLTTKICIEAREKSIFKNG